MTHAPRRLLIVLATILVSYCLSFPIVKPVALLSACEMPPREKCKWYHENTFVYGGKIGDKERKALDKLLDALVNAVDAGANEVAAVKKAIDELGPAGDVVDVVLVYVCEDEDGKIHRKKVTLDNTENIHWAAKAAKDPDNARSQQTIIAKYGQGSCCKPKTQTPNAVKNQTDNGAVRTSFQTPQGEVKVNLPDDMAAGDTVSGTVTVEPAGNSDASRGENQKVLEGCVIELEGQKTKVKDKIFIRTIPIALTPNSRTLSLSCDGQPDTNAEIPISATQPPAPKQFTVPTGGQQGQNIQIIGSCNGLFSTEDVVNIGGTAAPPIAESPRKLIVQDISEATGPTKIEVKENGATMDCPFRNIGIKLSAPKTDLRRGEKTMLQVQVMGLQGINQPLPLDLVNQSPSIINMGGGVSQHTTINPSAVQPNGTWSTDRNLTGIQAGAFNITGTVTWGDTCNGGVGGPIAGGPTAQPTPTPLVPTDAANGEVCKWINYKSYRADEFKRVDSTSANLAVAGVTAGGGRVAVSYHCKAAGTFVFIVRKDTPPPDVGSVTCK